ncbi:MAG: zinc ribbon domain-containing protein [Candidatus Dadabacteria bacterium]|nr:zinc ribbon domain-containing protein [Candidatus Dadabacteria bacterium]
METVIILIISAAVAIYIALPFFLKRGSQGNDAPVILEVESGEHEIEKLKSLDNQKETLYSAIRDIDFDYELGKLSKEDFIELKNKYKLEAAGVLKEIDQIQNQSGTKTPDYELEQEILSYRKRKPHSYSDDNKIQEGISAFKSASNKTNTDHKCSGCGSEYSSADLFCSKCGASLN